MYSVWPKVADIHTSLGYTEDKLAKSFSSSFKPVHISSTPNLFQSQFKLCSLRVVQRSAHRKDTYNQFCCAAAYSVACSQDVGLHASCNRLMPSLVF